MNIQQIIEFENKLFEEYSQKRIIFINNLRCIDTDKLNNTQLINFAHDIKQITDNISLANENIDNYTINQKEMFNNDDSTAMVSIKNKLYIFYSIFYKFLNYDSDSDTEISESSISEFEPESESESNSEFSDSEPEVVSGICKVYSS